MSISDYKGTMIGATAGLATGAAAYKGLKIIENRITKDYLGLKGASFAQKREFIKGWQAVPMQNTTVSKYLKETYNVLKANRTKSTAIALGAFTAIGAALGFGLDLAVKACKKNNS